MLVFPQLDSGAVFQAGFRRSRCVPNYVNRLADGSEVRSERGTVGLTIWEAHLAALSDDEISRVTELFDMVNGRVGTFLFLDPADNLLRWSEDLSRNCWQKGPMLQISGGIDDPFGGNSAARVTNAGQGAQELAQVLAGPGAFQYGFSVYARAAVPCVASLSISASGGRKAATHVVDSSWRRITVSGSAGGGDQIAFAIELPAGYAMELYGFQVDAQPAASAYRKTLENCGLYSSARFDMDSIAVRNDAPNCHSAALRIIAITGA